ncbi:MAG: hypothetical protein V1881_02690, partial [Candidatus Micrarchaeota archaeon]
MKPEIMVVGAALLLAAGYLAYQYVIPEQVNVSIAVADKAGAPVYATVQLFADDRLVSEKKVLGEASFSAGVKRGARLSARATADGFLPGSVGVRGGSAAITLQRVTQTEPKADFIIATDAAALEGKYGAETTAEIRLRILALADAAEKDGGLRTVAVFVGENYSSLADAIAKLQPSYLLIVGGSRIVPFGEYGTPLKGAPGLGFVAMQDPLVPSDNGYGVLPNAAYDCNECYPDVAVGRLPDGNEEKSNSTILITLLDAAISAHSDRPELKSMSSLVSRDSFGGHLTHALYAQLGNSVIDAPPNYLSEAGAADGNETDRLLQILAALNPANAIFLSVHGSMPPYPQVFSASDGSREYFLMTRGLPPLEGQDFTDKIVLADACYGGNPYRAEGESLPILFLRNGAVA